MTVPRLVWLYVVFSLAPRVVQSYLFNLSGSAARCFNLYRVAVRAVCYICFSYIFTVVYSFKLHSLIILSHINRVFNTIPRQDLNLPNHLYPIDSNPGIALSPLLFLNLFFSTCYFPTFWCANPHTPPPMVPIKVLYFLGRSHHRLPVCQIKLLRRMKRHHLHQ